MTNSAKVTITAKSDDSLIAADREAMSKYDAFPPLLFMKSLSENTIFAGNENGIASAFTYTLSLTEEKVIRMLIGYYSFEASYDETSKELMNGNMVNEPVCAFDDEWLNIIPAFENEKDEVLRRELRWHVYNLEVMTTYSEYYLFIIIRSLQKAY